MSTTNSLSKILLAFMLLATVTFTACDDEAEIVIDDPSASLSGADFSQLEFEPGEIIDLTLTFSAPQGLSSINYQFFAEDGTAIGNKEFINPQTDIDPPVTENTGSVNLEFTTPDREGETLDLVIEVVDQSSANDAATTFSFDVVAGIQEYTTVLLGGFLNSTDGSFYNSLDNVVYLVADAQQNDEMVDLLFYYANTPGYTIAAPDNTEAQQTWDAQAGSPWPLAVENSTRFKLLSNTFDYASVSTSTGVINAYPETGTPESRITSLSQGDKVAFVLDDTRGTRYGIFEVAEISGSQGSERAITLNVKVQN